MILTRGQATQIFDEGMKETKIRLKQDDSDNEKLLRWIGHSQVVAVCAFLIAQKCDNLNPEIAYNMGLLHDIGRKSGKMGLRHVMKD